MKQRTVQTNVEDVSVNRDCSTLSLHCQIVPVASTFSYSITYLLTYLHPGKQSNTVCYL